MDFEDLMVGHSYFFVNDEYELELKWQYEILPLLNEYINDGIVNAKPIKSDMALTDCVGEWHPVLAK
jgi:5-methylcytosine-specific restriction protein B